MSYLLENTDFDRNTGRNASMPARRDPAGICIERQAERVRSHSGNAGPDDAGDIDRRNAEHLVQRQCHRV